MKIALIISSVLEPMFVLVALAAFAGWKYGLNGMAFTVYLWYLLAFIVVIALVRVILAKRNKTNWDLSDRKKRIGPILVLTFIFAVNTVAVSFIGNRDLTLFYTVWLLWCIGFSMITLRTKISGHLSVATLTCGMLVLWYGWRVVPIVAVLPVLAWSRVVLKRHTFSEVIWGTLYACVLLLIASAVL